MNSFVHAHQMAKKLNNTAALCIETGQFDRGISCLVEALQLSDRQNAPRYSCMDQPVTVCQCHHCSLDECIAFSERTPLETTTTDTTDGACCHCNHSQQQHHHHHHDHHQQSSQQSYIHRRPIRVTPQSLPEDHNMGVTLSLIITYNLALAHHLSALSTFTGPQQQQQQNNDAKKANKCKETFQKILHLYELAYRWQIELEEDRLKKQRLQEQQQQFQDCYHLLPSALQLEASPTSSLRFNMIISNNLGQIHRLVHNEAKHQRCLEHLLATIMFVVVNEGTASGTVASASRHTRRQHHRNCCNGPPQYMDLEGFLLNASPLILQGKCAGAA